MSLSGPSIVLLVLNLGLLWLLMAAPLGVRTIVVRRRLKAAPDIVWAMVHPLGRNATWSPSLIDSHAVEGEGRVMQTLSNLDRRGQPMRRLLQVQDAAIGAGYAFASRVVEDTVLDPKFWSDYSERRSVKALGDGCELTVEVTDRYRGLAFFLFRQIMLRRELSQLAECLKTGRAVAGEGMLESAAMQVLLALVSTLMLWPFFGLDLKGLALSSILTLVIVLHELGHMAAYRAFGHKRVRMIFIPLLGGLAVGERPYNSSLEVAVCALMGAGMSALLVPLLIALHVISGNHAQSLILLFLLVLGAFNMLNLLPMTRFDGGQVLRQVFPTRDGLMGASFLVTAAILWAGWRIGIPVQALYGGLAVMAILSFITQNSVKPRETLDDMTSGERLNVGLGYYAVLAIHANALVYACDRLFVGS